MIRKNIGNIAIILVLSLCPGFSVYAISVDFGRPSAVEDDQENETMESDPMVDDDLEEDSETEDNIEADEDEDFETDDSDSEELFGVSTLYADKTLVEVDDAISLFWIPASDTAQYQVIWEQTQEPIGVIQQIEGTNFISMGSASEGVLSFTLYSINNGVSTRGNTVTITVTPNTLEASTLSVNKTEFKVGETGIFSWTSVPAACHYTLNLLDDPFCEFSGSWFVPQAFETTATQAEYIFNKPGVFTFMVSANRSNVKLVEGNRVTVYVS